MLPEEMKLEPIKGTARHFRGLARLMNDKRVGEIVNACDAGREGELIFRYVYELAQCAKPTLRFWVSSLTVPAIRAGLAALRPGSDYDPLSDAAHCRAEADWLVGMNGTRGLTALGGTLLSVGRVQTPTLAMVVDREREIDAFVPESFWEVKAELSAEKGRWSALWIGAVGAPEPKDRSKRGRLPSAESAEEVAAALRGAAGEVTEAERDIQKVPPPQLHHLTSLQQAANRRYGMTAKSTLQVAQALYEKHKLLTYPRTDSRFLSADVAAGLDQVVKGLATGPYAVFCAELQRRRLPKLGRRFVDDGKVSDHHAIVPTGKSPDSCRLNVDERRIFDIVVRQLLGAMYPPAVYAKTRLEAHVAGHRLEARGRVRMELGWEAVNPPAKSKKTGQTTEAELPSVEVGDAVTADKAEVSKKETRPPPRYNEASLLGAMEHAGRTLDEAELRAAMRAGGLGTPATRAATIETLLRRRYIARQGRNLLPAPAGRALVSALPVEALKNPRLTGEWEARLQAIAQGKADAAAFRRDIRRFVSDVVATLKAAPRVVIPEAAVPRGRGKYSGRRSQRSGRTTSVRRRPAGSAAKPRSRPKKASGALRCPRCGQGEVMRGNRGWGCTRWREGCQFVVWFEQDGVLVPDEEAERLFRRGQTRLFAKHPSDGPKARLVLDLEVDGNVRWEATKRGKKRSK
jgi:DNA topoisomerase-3